MTIVLSIAVNIILFIGFIYYKKNNKKLNSKLNQKNEEYESLKKCEVENKTKSSFLANIGHEIRTPLNAIIGFSELLALKSNNSKDKEYIEAINSSGNSLLTLVNDLLDMSKIEAGMFEVQFEAVNLENLINSVKSIFNIKFIEEDIEFRISTANNLPEIIILNEIRLKQILINLLGNALKFTDKGYVELRVSCENTGNSAINLVIEVEDSGIGIHENELNEIFKSFKQQKNQNASKYGGTGLGLTISKEIAKALHGEISVKSKIKKGSIFKVVFNNVKIGKKADTKIIDFPADTQFIKSDVIIADDNKLNRRVLHDLLASLNFEVYEAKNGKELLLLTDKVSPAFIISDIKMPVLDGIDSTRILKLDEQSEDTPIIALTSYAETNFISEGDKVYFDEFLTKPIARNELITVISKYCQFKK